MIYAYENEAACCCWNHFFKGLQHHMFTVLRMKEWRKSKLCEFIFIEHVAWFNFLVGILSRLNRILVVNHPNQLKEKETKRALLQSWYCIVYQVVGNYSKFLFTVRLPRPRRCSLVDRSKSAVIVYICPTRCRHRLWSRLFRLQGKLCVQVPVD